MRNDAETEGSYSYDLFKRGLISSAFAEESSDIPLMTAPFKTEANDG